MEDFFEARARGEFFYEDSTTDGWKKGDKVPPGYRVVFGKLRKVGGAGKQGAPAAPAKGGAGGGHKDVSWQDMGLLGGESKHSSDADAKEAAQAINDTIRGVEDWAKDHADKIVQNKQGAIDFDDDDTEAEVNDMVNSVLHDYRHTGTKDREVEATVWKMVDSAIRRAAKPRMGISKRIEAIFKKPGR